MKSAITFISIFYTILVHSVRAGFIFGNRQLPISGIFSILKYRYRYRCYRKYRIMVVTEITVYLPTFIIYYFYTINIMI